jgi:hypothetical protein
MRQWRRQELGQASVRVPHRVADPEPPHAVHGLGEVEEDATVLAVLDP